MKLDDTNRWRHHEGLPVPFRKRMAARAHAVDEALSQGGEAGTSGPKSSGRRLQQEAPAPASAVTYSATGHQPCGCRVRFFDHAFGGSAASHRRVVLDRAPFVSGDGITGPITNSCCGCRARRKTWTSSSTSATSAPTARTCGKSGSRGQQVPVAKGWLRASHRKLDPAEVAAVSSVSRARRTLVVGARRAGRMRNRNLAGVHGVRQRASASASTSSRATASAARPTCIIRGGTTRAA